MDTLEHKETTWFWSNKIIFELPIDSNAKLVYIFLCRIAGKSHNAYPSYSTIGKKCGIKSRTIIKKAINTLMEAGLLDYRTRMSKEGDKSSNVYTLYDEPNEKVIRKYHTLNHSGAEKCSAHEATIGGPLNEQPCPPDEQPPTYNGLPSVQNLDNPSPLNEHNQSLSKNRSFKNQSINQDRQTDTHELQNLFETIGMPRLKHAAQIQVIESALTDLLQNGRAGKKVYPREEIAATLQNLTVEKIDAALDRWEGQSKKRSIPSPYEYIKTCLFAAGKEVFVQQPDALPDFSGRTAPTYDLDEFVQMSMDRLMGDKQERRE